MQGFRHVFFGEAAAEGRVRGVAVQVLQAARSFITIYKATRDSCNINHVLCDAGPRFSGQCKVITIPLPSGQGASRERANNLIMSQLILIRVTLLKNTVAVAEFGNSVWGNFSEGQRMKMNALEIA